MIIVFIMILLAALVGGPLLVIWSLNTLFGLGIAYNVWTWLAATVLGALVASGSSK
jgi:hypothetical protein